VDSSGKVHISYLDYTSRALKYSTNAPGYWGLTTVDTGDTGEYTSIAVDTGGKIHVSYFDGANGALKYATGP
jgi:hypothetical protein